MEEPSTTGSGASGVMNGTGKAGGRGRGGKGREEVVRREGRGAESIESMLYQSILSGRHCRGNSTYMLPLARSNLMLQ